MNTTNLLNFVSTWKGVEAKEVVADLQFCEYKLKEA